MLPLHWSLVIISETNQYCRQDTVPRVQTCSLPPVPRASPCRRARLVSLCRERVQRQTPLRKADRGSAIPSASNRDKSCTRNLKELLAPESTPRLKSILCTVLFLFFICVAFCAWTPTIYSVKGNAAFQEGSLKKPRAPWLLPTQLHGDALPMGSSLPVCSLGQELSLDSSCNAVEEIKPLKMTKFWFCFALNFRKAWGQTPGRLRLALLHQSLWRCVD